MNLQGFCIQITWVEHAEIEEKPVHQIFSHFVYNGMAFGAHRWLSVLERQCERIASLMARNITDLGGSKNSPIACNQNLLIFIWFTVLH